MCRMKKGLVLLVCAAMLALPLAASSLHTPGTLPILTYHHLVPDGQPCNEMTVTVSRFEAHLAWLRDAGYTTILPSQLLSGEPLPEKPVMITFDDGYRSNYELAFPLLRQYGARAVISVIVSLVDAGEPAFCTWEMLREMEASGLVEIGSHSCALHNLDSGGVPAQDGTGGLQRRRGESDADFERRVPDDLRKSRERLSAELGRPPAVFCFPFGITEPDARGCVEALFPVSFVTRPGFADPARSTRYLPRFTVSMDVSISRILDAES